MSLLRTQHRQDAVARVVRSQLHRHGPLQHRADALAHGTGGLGLHVPDGREDLQHVGAVDLGDRTLSVARERVTLEAAQPVLRVVPATPAALLLLHDAPGGFGKRGHSLDAALVGQGVSARARQFAVGEGQFAGLGERDERDGAESELAAATADDEPLYPASCAGGLDEEVQAVAVCVPSWRGTADEGDREGLFGMAPAALGSAGCGGGFDYSINHHIICGNGARFTEYYRPDRDPMYGNKLLLIKGL